MKKHTTSGFQLKISVGKASRTNSSSNLRKKTPITPIQTESQKSLHARHLSPFQQATSTTSIYKSLLPSFCRIPVSPTSVPQLFQAGSERPKPLKALKTNTEKVVIDEEVSLIMREKSSDLPSFCNFSIKIFDLSLNPSDLLSFRLENILTLKSLEACLKIMIKKNRSAIFHKSRSLKETFIIPLSVSSLLFSSDESPEGLENLEKPVKNLAKFELVVFPIYLDYWTVAFCDLLNKSIKFYDPVGIETHDRKVKFGIRYYLKDLQCPGDRSIYTFKYENITEAEVYDHIDSSVYILMQIFKYSIKKDFEVTPENIQKFRRQLLFYTLKHGRKTFN